MRGTSEKNRRSHVGEFAQKESTPEARKKSIARARRRAAREFPAMTRPGGEQRVSPARENIFLALRTMTALSAENIFLKNFIFRFLNGKIEKIEKLIFFLLHNP